MGVRVIYRQDVSLEEILTEGGGEIQVVPHVGEGAMCLKSHCVARVQELVDGRQRCQWYGEALGSACCQDYVLRHQSKEVPFPRLSFRFALLCAYGAEEFRVFQSYREVAQDSC